MDMESIKSNSSKSKEPLDLESTKYIDISDNRYQQVLEKWKATRRSDCMVAQP
jgi:hypothetical protein